MEKGKLFTRKIYPRLLSVLLCVCITASTLMSTAAAAYTPETPGTDINLERVTDAGVTAVASYERTNDGAVGTSDQVLTAATGTSRWASSRNGYGVTARDHQEWIYIDLGSEKAIKEVRLNWEGAYAATYEIQVTNDTTPQPMTAAQNSNSAPGGAGASSSPITKSWTTVGGTRTGAQGNQTVTVEENGRYVQIKCLTAATDYGYSLYSFQVIGRNVSSVPALGSLTVDLTPGIENVTLAPQTPQTGFTYYYVSSGVSVTAPDLDDNINTITGAAAYTENTVIPGTPGTPVYVRVYKVDSATQEIKASGQASAVPKESGGALIGTIYVNGKTGSDGNTGKTPEDPFKTIQKAADVADAGDVVVVAEGLYREHVKPAKGGTSESNRITYIADGDVVIKGSEQIPTVFDGKDIGWVQDATPGVWKVSVPNKFFYEPSQGGRGSGGWTNGTQNTVNDDNAILDYYNPFRQKYWDGGGTSSGYTAGDVYVDNYGYNQKFTLSDVNKEVRTWFYVYDKANGQTTIYVNFGSINPNSPQYLVEINARRQNFAPDEWGLKYLTVDGFTMMHAGNWYSSFPDQPERAQRGAIGVYGGLGWIIQNNRIINARSIGIDIGLGSDMWGGNEDRGVTQNKPLVKVQTWFYEGEKYGHHIVQNNLIDRCGQSGIAGVFSWKSQILNNQITNTNYRKMSDGAETGAIKLHYCNEGLIKGNYIQNMYTTNGGGIWTDWGCQGIRVTGNIVVNSINPFYAEAVYGPVLVDNNVFIGTNLRTLDGSGVVFSNNIIARSNYVEFPGNQSISDGTANATGSAINIDGSGRNTYWFEPHTVTPGLGRRAGSIYNWVQVSHPKQDFWWYNNLTAGGTIPDTNTSGYIKTHNKVNTYTNALTGVTYSANSEEFKLNFNLNTSNITGTHTQATKAAIGKIMYPNSSSTSATYTVGQDIQDDVTTDFFGKPYPEDAASAKIAGPFSDATNGANSYTLWPRSDTDTPKPLEINQPDDGGTIELPRDNIARYKIYSDNSHQDDDPDNTNADPLKEYDARRAFDGNTNTRWASKAADGSDVWVQVDLGDLYNINEVKIDWHTDYAKQYKLQVSETGAADSWRDMYSETNAARVPAWGGINNSHWTEAITGFIGKDAADANDDTSKYVRYIRLQGVERAGNAYSVWEFEVYGSLSPYRPPSHGWMPSKRMNLAMQETIPGDGKNPNSTAYASFARSPYVATNAIDGNTTTRWSNDHGSTTSSDWVYVDLGDKFTIDQIVLRWEAAYGRSFRIEVSDDAGAGNPSLAGASTYRSSADWNENKNHAASMTWTTVYETTTGSGGNQTITLAEPVDARCVRMVGLTPASQYGYSLYEFEVWGVAWTPSITGVNAPFEIDGTEIKGTVSNQVTGVNLTNMIKVSDGATWALYSDPNFRTEVSKNISPLSVGDTVRYIMVTSADGLRVKTYTIIITRKSSAISEFAPAPPMDGTLNPVEWGDKIFTLASGVEGVTVQQFNTRPGYPPADFNADIYMGYDASNLYLGLVVKDSLWTAAKTGSDLWQGCGIQLNLWSGKTGARSEYGFGLTASGPSHYQWATGATALTTGYKNYDIKRVDDTFIYTIAIPLTSFRQNAASNPLVEGDELWFSIAYNYPNTTGTNMSYAFDMGFHSKSLNDARSLTLAGVEKSIASGMDPGAYTASTNNSDAIKAFDNDLETKWESTEAGSQWIAADMGRRHSISRVVLDWGEDYAKAYKLQIAKKPGVWEDVYDSSKDAGRTANLVDGHWRESIDCKLFEGQYIRVLATESAGGKYSLWEFEVYGTMVTEDNGPQWESGAKLSIGNYTGTSLTLTWPTPKDRLGVAGFKLYQNDILVATLGWDVLEYAFSGLTVGTKYSYKLIPFNSDGTEGPELKATTAMSNPDPKVGVSNSYPSQYSEWADALVAGNGKQGIMVFGNPRNETVIFNDKYFFVAKSESNPRRTFNQFSTAQLNTIRDNLLAGNWSAANPTSGSGGANAHQWQGGGEGSKHVGYRMLFNVTSGAGDVRDYYRSTDYANGLVKVNWSDDDGDWERTSFVSRVDGVTVQNMQAPEGKSFDVTVGLNYNRTAMAIGSSLTPPNNTVTYNNDVAAGFLNIRLKYPSGSFDAGYEGVTKILTDGHMTATVDNGIAITDASYVTLLSRTQRYNGTFDSTKEAFLPAAQYKNTSLPTAEQEWNKKLIQSELDDLVNDADTADYDKLLARHTDNHSEIFNRVSFDLNASDYDRAKTNEELLEEQRLAANNNKMIPALYERLFYAGRYTLMGSGGETSAPDLLGNWTGSMANWDGSYHLDANLNLQISSGNIGNLPEIMDGYFWLNEQWQKDFRTNASRLLNARGMLTGGNSPGAGDGLISSINPSYPYQYVTGGESWLLYVFWEYYLVSGDKEFLRDHYYPMIRDMGDFYEDFLINNVPEEKRKDANGKYIFAGSISPETQPSGSGYRPLAVNSVYDVSGCKFALETLIETCEVLGDDLPLKDHAGEASLGWTQTDIDKWQEILDNLPSYYLNKDGALPEYLWPTIDNAVDYQHRHDSGLMPIWPYRDITKENNPTIYAGAQEFMRRKAGTTTGVSGSTDYTRAGHGSLHGALININLNMNSALKQNLLRFARGTYYTGLTSSHYSTIGGGAPPYTDFCTDTVNALPTLLMEMLATTGRGRIELLPSLPDDLKKGYIDGMLGRSQFTIDHLEWDMDKEEVVVELTSDIDQTLSLILRQGISKITVVSGSATIKSSEYGNIARNVTLTKNNPVTLKIKMGEGGSTDPIADKTALNALIDEAEALVEENYEPESWAGFEQALDEAKRVNDDEDATQDEVDAAVEALQAAIDALEEIKDDPYADLQTLIAEAEELVEADYTADTWAELESALSAAKEITAEDDKDDIVAAYEALRKAIDELEGYVAVTSVKIDGAAIQQVRMRNTKQFTATVNPTNATDPSLTWESSNEKIFTVKDGLVTGIGTGSAKLIITASNGKTSFIMVQITA